MSEIDKKLRYFNPLKEIEKSDAVLPHWSQPGITCFITFRLADSIPRKKLDDWKLKRDAWLAIHPKPWRTEEELEFHSRFSSTIERWLDQGYGSCALRIPYIAKTVGDGLNYFDGVRCIQHSWIVMPNHVHALVTPVGGTTIRSLLHLWKSYTATKVNRILGRSGTFWQRDYFDRIIRDANHFRNCLRYIRRNPNKAGLRGGEFLAFESAWVRTLDI